MEVVGSCHTVSETWGDCSVAAATHSHTSPGLTCFRHIHCFRYSNCSGPAAGLILTHPICL